MFDEIDQDAVDTIRMLAVQMIAKAQSGHPGLPLGCAPMAYTLYRNHLTIDPAHPDWFNRDRFILSAGHGSAMLYALNYLAGYDLNMDDLKRFRQLGSRTPGHPEYNLRSGIEATTGPLGQGLGMAVGMAMAERHLQSQFGQDAVSHFTYTLVGDGDLMEGVSHEAASLAGHLNLNKLVVLYDSNDVSLDGPKGRSCNDNTKLRFTGYGWDYFRVEDGTDLDAIDQALNLAKKSPHPAIIEVRTIIGYGTLHAGTNIVHGSPLCAADMAALKHNLHWDKPDFTVDPAVKTRFQETVNARGQANRKTWQQHLAKLPAQKRAAFDQAVSGKLPLDLAQHLPAFAENCCDSGRIASQKTIQALAHQLPTLWGGSADLASSNKTDIAGDSLFAKDSPDQRNIGFGIREFAEAAAMNGIALHGGSRIFGSTFLVFSDYMKGAIRLSALQHLPVIYIFTHDSIAVGEDGPTHEPIEQLMALRGIPNVQVLRPGDANEVAASWLKALQTTDKPTVLILSRQNMQALPDSQKLAASRIARGGYVLREASPRRAQNGILLATGTEISVALKAQQILAIQDVNVSVVAIPSFDCFLAQPKDYQDAVLPPYLRRRLSVEAGSTLGWQRFVGFEGIACGIDSFGASGAPEAVLNHFGFTPIRIASQFLQMHVANSLPQLQRQII